MCGICGHSQDPTGEAVRVMNRVLHHRGPDDSGVHVDEAASLALGATRLSIIDLAGGHQPLANEDGTVVAALNGEIYNYRSLRDQLRSRGHQLATSCDTEVLVHLYEECGNDLVHALDGMYAFALWDSRRRRLVLARDRFGEKPLFYRLDAGVLSFASELSALLPAGTAEPDVRAIDTYFVLGYLPSPLTMVEGVAQLPPGHVLVFEDGRATAEPYWHPPVLPENRDESEDLDVELERLLGDSVRSRMVADVPLGVFLSGGVDSTLVASFAAEFSSHPVQTFTVGYDVGGVSETVPARAASERLGTHHRELVVRGDEVEALARDLFTRLDQPIADQALLASYAVSRFARESVKVVVGGEGADELFGGYPRYRWLALAARLDGRVPPSAARLAAGGIRRLQMGGRAQRLAHVIDPISGMQRHLDWVTDGRGELRGRFYGPRLQASFDAEQLSSCVTLRSGDRPVDTARAFMLHDQALWLPDDVLAKADRSSMLASLEVRTPFLQPELADLAAGVTSRRHLQNGGKSLLRAVLSRRLPDAGAGRSKVAFRVPADDWLRGPLQPVLREQLATGRLYDGGYIDRVAVTRALDEHVSRNNDWTHVLWPLMVLAFWFEKVGGAAAV